MQRRAASSAAPAWRAVVPRWKAQTAQRTRSLGRPHHHGRQVVRPRRQYRFVIEPGTAQHRRQGVRCWWMHVASPRAHPVLANGTGRRHHLAGVRLTAQGALPSGDGSTTWFVARSASAAGKASTPPSGRRDPPASRRLVRPASRSPPLVRRASRRQPGLVLDLTRPSVYAGPACHLGPLPPWLQVSDAFSAKATVTDRHDAKPAVVWGRTGKLPQDVLRVFGGRDARRLHVTFAPPSWPAREKAPARHPRLRPLTTRQKNSGTTWL